MPDGILTGKDLIDAGWPEGRLIGLALKISLNMTHDPVQNLPLADLNYIREYPELFVNHPDTSELAKAVIEERERNARVKKYRFPRPYTIFGEELIEDGTLEQMRDAMKLKPAVRGALMPDAHLGYGLPVGGVWALDNAISPWAVGVDIACRMRMTIFEESPEVMNDVRLFDHALTAQTRFGAGSQFDRKHARYHPVLDDPRWDANDLTRRIRADLAEKQLGTSGGGNHFVEFAELDVLWDDWRVIESFPRWQFSSQKYLCLVSHSGSRRPGYDISEYYSKLAADYCKGLDSKLAWLPLDSDAGHEYYHLMKLAGDYAAANHFTIHHELTQHLGLTPIHMIENHHNFAWREWHDGRELIVHRKGATPAAKGQMGIIPGTMLNAGYLVMGKGNEESLRSTSHGAGRQMSRSQAKKKLNRDDWLHTMKFNGVHIMGGGLDEAPPAYKDIEKVMEAQKDLAHIVGKFQPKIVRMASDKGRF